MSVECTVTHARRWLAERRPNRIYISSSWDSPSALHQKLYSTSLPPLVLARSLGLSLTAACHPIRYILACCLCIAHWLLVLCSLLPAVPCSLPPSPTLPSGTFCKPRHPLEAIQQKKFRVIERLRDLEIFSHCEMKMMSRTRAGAVLQELAVISVRV